MTKILSIFKYKWKIFILAGILGLFFSFGQFFWNHSLNSGLFIVWFLILLSILFFIRLLLNFKIVISNFSDKLLVAASVGIWVTFLVSKLTYVKGPVVGFLSAAETYGWPFQRHFVGFIDNDLKVPLQNFLFWTLLCLLVLFIIDQIKRQFYTQAGEIAQKKSIKILIWAVLFFVSFSFALFLMRSPLPNYNRYSSLGQNIKLTDADNKIFALPGTTDFNLAELQIGGLSVSPDNQWLVYADIYSEPVRLTFYNLKNNKKFIIKAIDIVEVAKKDPTVKKNLDNSTVLPSSFEFFDMLSNWTLDSKDFYILDPNFSTIAQNKNIVIHINDSNIPVITFKEDTQDYSGSGTSLQDTYHLTCSDCNDRFAAPERYLSVSSKLPSGLNKNLVAVGSNGKVYFSAPKDKGVDIIELNTITGVQNIITHFYIPESLTTELSNIFISPDDQKIFLTIFARNTLNDQESYILDLSQNSQKIYFLGKAIDSHIFWSSDSKKLFFSCPFDEGTKISSYKNGKMCAFEE